MRNATLLLCLLTSFSLLSMGLPGAADATGDSCTASSGGDDAACFLDCGDTGTWSLDVTASSTDSGAAVTGSLDCNGTAKCANTGSCEGKGTGTGGVNGDCIGTIDESESLTVVCNADESQSAADLIGSIVGPICFGCTSGAASVEVTHHVSYTLTIVDGVGSGVLCRDGSCWTAPPTCETGAVQVACGLGASPETLLGLVS